MKFIAIRYRDYYEMISYSEILTHKWSEVAIEHTLACNGDVRSIITKQHYQQEMP